MDESPTLAMGFLHSGYNVNGKEVYFVAQPKLEKRSGGCIGPRARRLFSYIGVLARGWAAYVGYVAPQRVAMSAV